MGNVNIVYFNSLHSAVNLTFLRRIYWKEVFVLFIKNVLLLSPTYVRSQSIPRGPASLLAHCSMASDIICNSSSPPLVDIIHFGMLRIIVNLMVLKRLLGRGFHTFIKNVLLYSPIIDVGSHIIVLYKVLFCSI